MKFKGLVLDNYDKNSNGCIWLMLDENKVEIKHILSTNQLIHGVVFDLKGNFLNWLTIIYYMNQLEYRRILWRDIKKIHQQHQCPWFLIVDFNNLLKANDRIGNRLVTEA